MVSEGVKIQRVLDMIKTWSPPEQLELIQAILKLLQRDSTFNGEASGQVMKGQMPSPDSIRHTLPAMDLRTFVADFWPQDESADDINAFIYQQHQEDLQKELLSEL